MSNEVECPYCKSEFDVHDHYDSGEYECPECNKDIWIDVEYEAIYQSSCLDEDHDFQPIVVIGRKCKRCSRCGQFKIGYEGE